MSTQAADRSDLEAVTVHPNAFKLERALLKTAARVLIVVIGFVALSMLYRSHPGATVAGAIGIAMLARLMDNMPGKWVGYSLSRASVVWLIALWIGSGDILVGSILFLPTAVVTLLVIAIVLLDENYFLADRSERRQFLLFFSLFVSLSGVAVALSLNGPLWHYLLVAIGWGMAHKGLGALSHHVRLFSRRRERLAVNVDPASCGGPTRAEEWELYWGLFGYFLKYLDKKPRST